EYYTKRHIEECITMCLFLIERICSDQLEKRFGLNLVNTRSRLIEKGCR
ncbi:13605_t:CDS:1, partial [Racocetra persica]